MLARDRHAQLADLQRQFAYVRLFARLFVTEPDRWVLKGATPLLARLIRIEEPNKSLRCSNLKRQVVAASSRSKRQPDHVTRTSSLRPASSSTLTQRIKFMRTSDYVIDVTVFEPLRRIELTTRQGALTPTLTHTFEAADGGLGTHVTSRSRYRESSAWSDPP